MHGGVLLRFNGENGTTAVRYVQQIKGDAAMEQRGLFEPGHVFVQNTDGTETDISEVANDLIEVREQSLAGTTFVKVHGYDVDVVPLGNISKQMKSLDGVTVSDVNVPLSLGEIDILDRFDVNNPDIRHSTENVEGKINASLDGVTREGFVGRLGKTLDERIKSGRIVANDNDRERVREGAERFFDAFSRKKILLSDGRYVYFAPTSAVGSRTEIEDNVDAWVEYAIHAVTNDVAMKDGAHARKYNAAKVAALDDVERIIGEENVFASIKDNHPEQDAVIFVGTSGEKRTEIITRLDEYGNVDADLTEVTVVTRSRAKENPPTIPL